MNNAIKLAIEKGGYLDTKDVEYLTGGIIYLRGYDDEHRKIIETLYWNQIILDPLFWVALGKALGWDGCKCNGVHNEWKRTAHEYLDLVLTGGDTEAFWKDLLTNNPNDDVSE